MCIGCGGNLLAGRKKGIQKGYCNYQRDTTGTAWQLREAVSQTAQREAGETTDLPTLKCGMDIAATIEPAISRRALAGHVCADMA